MGNTTAAGAGTLEIDNCVPDCATGSFTGYPATVTLTGLLSFGSGAEAYSSMVISAPTAPYPAQTYTSGLVP